MGEGYDDAGIMPYIQLTNIACGGHAGNKNSMQKTLALAQKYQVKIGAHPSYPDFENFGRVHTNISQQALHSSIEWQVNNLCALHQPLHHIKAHGALYHAAAQEQSVFEILLNIAYKQQVALIVPSNLNLKFIALAKTKNIHLLFEAFADRAYKEDGSLVARTITDSVYAQKDKIISQVNTIKHGTVILRDKTTIPIYADTICLHGDNPASVQAAQFL